MISQFTPMSFINGSQGDMSTASDFTNKEQSKSLISSISSEIISCYSVLKDMK